MISPKTIHGRIADALIYLVMIVLSVIFLYPLLYVLFQSISDPNELVRHRGLLLAPAGLSSIAYKAVLSNPQILSGYKNTLFVLAVGLCLNIVLTSIGAYFLTRTKTLLYKPVMLMILISMYFSGGLIPTFLTVRSLGMYNSLWALIIPSAISTYNLILLRSYFASIPESLVESVSIDGGGHWTILFCIFIPLSKAAMAVMILYYGVGHWNSWFNAMIFIRDTGKYPLQLILREILITGDLQTMSNAEELIDATSDSTYNAYKVVKYCSIVVATVPILVIYPFVQRYFVKGVMVGSVKG